MSNSIVSIRMPKSLSTALRDTAEKSHFMDLSEELRFIIKEKMLQHIDPFSYELRKFKDDIKSEVSKKTQKDRVRFIEELRKILDDYKREGI